MATSKNGKVHYAIKRGSQYLCYDDAGRVIWEPWADTVMTLAEAQRVLATYAENTQRTMRIVEVRR